MIKLRGGGCGRDVRTILLIQLGDIGDVVLSLPALEGLYDHFPGARVVVAVREKARALLEDLHCADAVLAIDTRKRGLVRTLAHQLRFFAGLRRWGFDLAYDLRTGTRGAILALFSGAPRRIGFYATDGRLWRNRVFTRLSPRQYTPGQYVADYYASLLQMCGINCDGRPRLYVPSGLQKESERFLSDQGVPDGLPPVALQPFSLWRYKEWGTDKYVRLIDRIGSRYGLPVILTGGPEERTPAMAIAERCRVPVVNLAGRTSLSLLAAVLKRCILFIGVDSAGLHIAAAVGTPTVSLFGPSSPASWAPKGSRHRVIAKSWSCVPCRRKGCGDTEYSSCLGALEVEEVLPVIERQLDEIGSQWNLPFAKSR